MICPYCGTVDDDTPTPTKTSKGTTEALGDCPDCRRTVWAYPTGKSSEASQLATVRAGETREVALADAYVDYAGGATHEDRGRTADIDRRVVDEDGDLLYFLEIKERSCSLNGYRKTMFPYAKIEAAERLIDEHDAPVHVVLKFLDCWARDVVDPDRDYESGDEPFFPGYRPSQATSDRQVPVRIPVEDLEVLSLRDGCEVLDGDR
jgi:hypothetical protein